MAMGARDTLDRFTSEKLYLRRHYLNSGGYDKYGSYWGAGVPLYKAENDSGDARYVRAHSRDDAKSQFPKATFYR